MQCSYDGFQAISTINGGEIGYFMAILTWWLYFFWKYLRNVVKKSLQQSEKFKSRYAPFCFPPACNHVIFCVTQIQLYRVGNWQFRYYYDIWKSLTVFWKILCDKASQIKIWDVLFSMLSFIRYFLFAISNYICSKNVL